MELKEGMYVRTKQGYIAKYLREYTTYNMDGEYDSYYEFDDNIAEPCYGNTIPIECCSKNMFIKQSYNIIDLIEVGDYVNGVEVENINDEWITMSDTKVPILKSIANGLIKSIVTKEQFESMTYKVKE